MFVNSCGWRLEGALIDPLLQFLLQQSLAILQPNVQIVILQPGGGLGWRISPQQVGFVQDKNIPGLFFTGVIQQLRIGSEGKAPKVPEMLSPSVWQIRGGPGSGQLGVV